MVIIDSKHKNSYKWGVVWTALILATWFGHFNQAYADIYSEFNAQRMPIYTAQQEWDFNDPLRGLPRLRSKEQIRREMMEPSEKERYGEDAKRWQQKSEMYECIQNCAGNCRYLEGFSAQECRASEERCKANCR